MTDNAEWNAAIDAALTKVREQRAVFSSDAYATPQPIGGFMERFACNSIEVEIEALRKPDTPPTPAAEEREAVAQWCSGCHEVRSVDCYRAGCPKSDTERRAAEILAAEANERARIAILLEALVDISKAAMIAKAMCDDADREPWQMIADRARKAIDAHLGRNEHGAGK